MPPPPAETPRRPLKWSVAWREARDLMWVHRWRLALGLQLMVISRLAGMVLPGTSKYLIDDVIGKSNWALLPILAWAAGVAVVVEAISSFAVSQILGVAAQRAITTMRKDVQAHLLRLPVRFFDSAASGQLISRVMTDAEGVRNLVGNGLVQLVGASLTAIVALSILITLNWQLTLAVLAVFALTGVVMARAFSWLRPQFRQRGKLNAEVSGRLGEAFGGIRVIKAYVAEPREEAVFAAGAESLFDLVRRTMTGVSALTGLSALVIGVTGVLVMVVGGQAIREQSMTLGELIWFTFLVALVAAPVAQIAQIGTQISEAFAGLDRIREVRRLATERDDDASRAALGDLAGAIRFAGVSFAYEGERDVLRDITFDAAPGTTTALVGPSGSGKSTLVALVMGFHHPRRGQVLIDGRPLDEVRLSDYRARLGVVLQDNFLFDGTVAENISFARPAATRAEVEAAARLANCDDFVAGFPKGYDTVVGERGVKLSGGQRQRVAIARALLADPRILILDEATSSLDSESEARIQEALSHLRRGRTTFVIAHRLSTIVAADQILVLDQGAIVERGTHADLLANGGLYRRLYERQHHVESDRFVNPGEVGAAG